MEKYKFTAKECTFEDAPGYMVIQYREDWTKAAEGWIPTDECENFCKAIGTNHVEINNGITILIDTHRSNA